MIPCFCAALVSACHNELPEIVTERAQDLLRLCIRAFIKDLAQVAKSIDARHKPTQTRRLKYELRNPFVTEDEKLVNPCGLKRLLDLGGYFGHFYAGDNYLLAASAERLFRISADGTVAWASRPLGIDGVIVNIVADGIIDAEG